MSMTKHVIVQTEKNVLALMESVNVLKKQKKKWLLLAKCVATKNVAVI
jgi:hypothetical protein